MFSPEPDGARPWTPDHLTKAFQSIRTKLGLHTVRLHDLRHFAATRLLAAGVPVRTVSGRLGHANPSTTLSVYAHFLEASDQAAAAIMGDLLQAADRLPRTLHAAAELAPFGTRRRSGRMRWQGVDVHNTLILACGFLALVGGIAGMAMWFAGRRPSGWVHTVSPAVEARMTVDPNVALQRRIAMHRMILVAAIVGTLGGVVLIAVGFTS